MAPTIAEYLSLDKDVQKAKRKFKGGSVKIRAKEVLSKEQQNQQILQLYRVKDEAYVRREEVMQGLLRERLITVYSYKEFRVVVNFKIRHKWLVTVILAGSAATERATIKKIARKRGIQLSVGP